MPYKLPTHTRNSLLSTPIKQIILFLSLSFALAFLIHFTRASFFGPLDVMLFYLINSGIKNPFFDFAMPFFSLNWITFVLVAIFFMYLIVNKGVKIALALLIVFIFIFPFSILLKKTASLNRPYASLSDVYYYTDHGRWLLNEYPSTSNTYTSFPSGHTLRFFVLVGFFWAKRKVRYFLLTIGFLVMLSRVYTGAHYPSDTIFSAFFATYLGFLAQKIN